MSILPWILNSQTKKADISDAVDLDGTNDYYSRASDFTGNADSKTFTVSLWLYLDKSTAGSNSRVYRSTNGSDYGMYLLIQDAGYMSFTFRDVSNTNLIAAAYPNPDVTPPPVGLPYDTFFHVLMSVDLTSGTVRHFYFNDEDKTSVMKWSTYVTGTDIDFTKSNHWIGSFNGTSGEYKGRLGGHFFLDYTYRDLSVEANRRLFVNEDLTPAPIAGLVALSPIILIDYSDVSTAMINLGTGGDFTQNGTIAQSGRGPAQYNPAACFFDNAADYMTATGATIGASDSKEFTLAFMAKRAENLAGSQWVIDRGTGAAGRLTVDFGSTNLNITARNSAGTVIFNVTHALSPAAFKWYHIYCAVDLTDSGLFKLEVDGVDVGATPSTYSNDTINFASTETWRVFQRFNGDPPDRDAYLSCIFLDTNYTGANSFYDTDTGKAKYLGSMGELPTGSQPLIYLPLYGNDAGNNLGSGGDFTVNSGPYTGARGFNEFWSSSVTVDGTNYLSHAGIFCKSLIKWKSTDSGATWSYTTANDATVTDIGNGTDNGDVAYYYGTSDDLNWADEETLLRFVDAFGYPVAPVVDANTVLYTPFDATLGFEYNAGSGGDFTETGTVTQAGDVKG